MLLLTFLILFQTISSEFCKNQLFESAPLCEDGSVVNSNGCCASTNRCPKSCLSWSFRMRNGVTTCSCNKCPLKPKIDLSTSQRWLKAHNYFRCLHGQDYLEWSGEVAINAQRNTDQCIYSHSSGTDLGSSYKFTPASGENIAMGYPSIEDTVEGWYSEIKYYKTGMGFTSGVGHYTALMWKSTSLLGCSSCDSKGYSVCEYAESPPNYGKISEYVKNVPQKNELVNTEEYCCSNIYGGSFLSKPHQAPTGAQRDDFGCIPSAGYKWCESKQFCYRDFEVDCPIIDESTRTCHDVKITIDSDSTSPTWSFGIDTCNSEGSTSDTEASCCLHTNRVYAVTCSGETTLYLKEKEVCRGPGGSHIALNDKLGVDVHGRSGMVSAVKGLAEDTVDLDQGKLDMASEAAYVVGGMILALMVSVGCYIFCAKGVPPGTKPSGYANLPEKLSI